MTKVQQPEALRIAETLESVTEMECMHPPEAKRIAKAIHAQHARIAELGAELEHANQWRDLALQFDGHRMQALWHLKAMANADTGTLEAKAAGDFLNAGPLPGEQVLAQRIAELAALKAAPADWQEVVRLANVAISESDGAPMVQDWMSAAMKVCRHVASPLAAPTAQDGQPFLQWWNESGHRAVSVGATGSGWKGAAEVGYLAGQLHGGGTLLATHTTFTIGQHVRKKSGSQWQGRVVGYYSTDLTPEGYAVESGTERGSVQIYPAKALEVVEGGAA